MSMLKKVILILICLTLLISCGRKNDPKYEVLLNSNLVSFNTQNKTL